MGFFSSTLSSVTNYFTGSSSKTQEQNIANVKQQVKNNYFSDAVKDAAESTSHLLKAGYGMGKIPLHGLTDFYTAKFFAQDVFTTYVGIKATTALTSPHWYSPVAGILTEIVSSKYTIPVFMYVVAYKHDKEVVEVIKETGNSIKKAFDATVNVAKGVGSFFGNLLFSTSDDDSSLSGDVDYSNLNDSVEY